ncbi:hypothetical protein FCV25MIE_16355, partial [Fagus crenata]
TATATSTAVCSQFCPSPLRITLKLKSSPFPTLPYHEPSPTPTPTPTPPSQKPPSTKPKIPIHATLVISDSRSLSGGSNPSKSNPMSKNTGLSRTDT